MAKKKEEVVEEPVQESIPEEVIPEEPKEEVPSRLNSDIQEINESLGR